MGLSGAAVALETFGAQALSLLLLPALQCSMLHGPPGSGLGLSMWAMGLPAGATMLTAMLMAALHRRHLMVWAVFAPRLLFGAAHFVLVSLIHLAQMLSLELT